MEKLNEKQFESGTEHFNFDGKVYTRPVHNVEFGDGVAVISRNNEVETTGIATGFLYESVTGEFYINIKVAHNREIPRRICEVAKLLKS